MNSSNAAYNTTIEQHAALPTTLRYCGAFGAVGIALIALQPGALLTFTAMVAFSFAIAALAVATVRDIDSLEARRGMIRWISAALMAGLLWLAILGGTALAGGHGALAMALAVVLFAGLVAVEAAVAAVVTMLFATINGSDPAIGIALQVSDKYAGFAGKLN